MQNKKYKLYPTGIYCITCKANGKKYVGQTRGNVKRRVGQHLSDCKCQRHVSPAFQNSYNKYSRESFDYEMLEEIPKEKGISYFTEREQYWIDKLDTYKNGLNACPKAELPPAAANPEKYADLYSKKKVPSGYKYRNVNETKWHNFTNFKKFCRDNDWNYGRAQNALYGANKHIYDNRDGNQYEIRLANEDEAKYKEKGKQAHLNGKKSTFIVTFPDGHEEKVAYLKDFCKEHGLNRGNLMMTIKGTRNHTKEFKARYDFKKHNPNETKHPKDIAIEQVHKYFEKHPNNVIPTNEIRAFVKEKDIKGISGQGNLTTKHICEILELPKQWFSRARKCYCISKVAFK